MPKMGSKIFNTSNRAVPQQTRCSRTHTLTTNFISMQADRGRGSGFHTRDLTREAGLPARPP